MNRNSLQVIKKEVDDGRDKLIRNLEGKVNSLQLEREILLKKEELRRAQNQIVR